jgi:hypothetical protein
VKDRRREPSPFPGIKRPNASSSAAPLGEPREPEPFHSPTDLEAFKRQTSEVPRKYAEKAPTIAPPDSDVEVSATDEEIDPFELENLPENTTNERVTITNEVELETARLQSVVRSSVPPDRESQHGPEPPSGSLLSLANLQAPTVPPPRDYESSRKIAAAAPADEMPVSEAPTGVMRTADPMVEMRDRLSLGDYTGALQVAESILSGEPSNEEALACAETCRQVLVKMYSARIGPLDKVPIVMVPRHQMRWLTIDHRAGFILSHIDGVSSLEMILDVSGMPPLDALRILYELFQQRVISFR